MSINDQQLLETMHEIGGLLYRRLTGELSEREQIDLDQWMIRQDFASRQFFEECADHEQVYAALAVMYEFDQEAALADLQKRIQFEVPQMASEIRYSRRIYRWYHYLIAASVLAVVIGASVFFVFNKKNIDIATLPISQRFKNDVAPGGQKATLKLEDGSVITLDNASNGQLAKQGNTKVMKLDGQLAYHAGGANAEKVLYNTISTPRGGQYQVVLPDESTVWLNAASTLRFPTAFNGKERIVELTGEAYFQIAKNASKPFKVNVAGTDKSFEIEVLGTEFDVMAYADEDGQKATLISGAVKVNANDRAITLKPGEQALNKKSSLNLISDINTDEVVAWKNGLFQFRDQSIESIMRQVSRWYDVEVVYDGKVNQQFVGTIPRQVNISTLLKILEATGWVHFTVEGKKLTVSP